MNEVSNAKELLNETLDILNEKKIAAKALADVTKRVTSAASVDRSYWKKLIKAYARKGNGWIGNNPLDIDPTEEHKDGISPIFSKLAGLITVTEMFNLTDPILTEYLEKLEELGITIKIDSDKFRHCETTLLDTDIEEELDSAKAYLATMDDYSDEIRNEHTARSEELNFAPKSGYMKVVNIFKKVRAGKDVEDDVQNILTYNNMLDTAVNLVHDSIA